MKQGLSLLLSYSLICTSAMAQGKKKAFSAEEVRSFAETAFKHDARVSITLKHPNVARSAEYCTDYPRKISVKITCLDADGFSVEENDFFLGDISGAVAYDNVEAIKLQNNTLRGIKKPAVTTGFVSFAVAALPVFLGGMAICAASNGKHARWACPR